MNYPTRCKRCNGGLAFQPWGVGFYAKILICLDCYLIEGEYFVYHQEGHNIISKIEERD